MLISKDDMDKRRIKYIIAQIMNDIYFHDFFYYLGNYSYDEVEDLFYYFKIKYHLFSDFDVIRTLRIFDACRRYDYIKIVVDRVIMRLLNYPISCFYNNGYSPRTTEYILRIVYEYKYYINILDLF